MNLYIFNPKNLNYDDSGEFIVRFLTDIKNQKIDLSVDLDLKELYNSLEVQSLILNKALAQIAAKAESKELLVLDQIRDRNISTVRSQFNVYKNSNKPAIKEAYNKVKVILKAYKGLESRNYPSETGGIISLIGEMTNSTNKPFSDLLLLGEHIADLKIANDNFVAKFDKRSSDVISTETYDTKKLRKIILETYAELVDYVVVIAKRRKNEYYDTLITTMNYSRKYFADILARGGATPPETPAAK